MIAKKEKIKKNSKFSSIFFSLLLGVFLVGVVGFLITSNLRISQKRADLIEKREGLQNKIQELKERKEALEAGISQTEETDYWEEKARARGYKKEGEEAVVVLPSEEKKQENTQEEKGVWQKILDFFNF